jgi:hypothetical protein
VSFTSSNVSESIVFKISPSHFANVPAEFFGNLRGVGCWSEGRYLGLSTALQRRDIGSGFLQDEASGYCV